ncbi:MAG: glycosyltransferase family 2 protein, partial [Methylococcales bacterium]|nr:glycosyltransferase family 2 protein [Methylococcales bacterium]
IIILDSGSNDNTVELCKAYTPHVFSTDWQGFGIQKQRALEKSTGDWVLSIDADEKVSTLLKAEIQQAIKSDVDGFEIARQSRYCGKVIQHAGWSPDYVLRLFKREKGKFSPDLVHERVIVKGIIKKLTQPLKHEAFVNPDEVLNKINTYSSLGAKKLYNEGKQSSLMKAVLKGGWMFIRTYFIKAAILDGEQGLMLAISNAEGTYYKYVKLWDLQRTQG